MESPGLTFLFKDFSQNSDNCDRAPGIKLFVGYWMKYGTILFSAFALISCTPSTSLEIPQAQILDESNNSSNLDTDKPGMPAQSEAPADDSMVPADTIDPEMDTQKELPPTQPQPETLPEAPKEPDEPPVIPSGKYTIRSAASNRCLDIAGANKADGQQLEIYDCAAKPSQQQTFAIKYVGKKFYEISNVSTAKPLMIRGQEFNKGQLIEQSSIAGGKFQQFEFIPQDDGTVKIRSQSPDLFWDVQGGHVENKTPVQVWVTNDSANQRFTLTLVP